MSDIVQKLWGFCHTLRHDGIDYGDYIEQITFLLFLKMADERGVDVAQGLRLADAARHQRHGVDRRLHRSAPQARQRAAASSATSSPRPSAASTIRSTSSGSST